MSSPTTDPDRGAPALLPAFARGLAIALVLDLALYFLGRALGAFPKTLPDGNILDHVPVAVATTVGMVGATAVFALMRRFMARPAPAFRILALVLMLASFVTPFGIPNADAAVIVLLNLMHVVVALAAIAVLTPRR